MYTPGYVNHHPAPSAKGEPQPDLAKEERDRIGGIVRLGQSTGKPLQALHLALLTPLSVEGATPVLKSMPTDQAESQQPIPASFSKHDPKMPKAVADERQRIVSILTSEEAKRRETLAYALAFDTTTPVAQGLAVLKAAFRPPTAAAFSASMEERIREAGQFGPSFDPSLGQHSRGDRISQAWANAIKQGNTGPGSDAHARQSQEADVPPFD